MKKISLQFEYSLEYEVKRIADMLKKAKWLIENGYAKKVRLPDRTDFKGVYNKKDALKYLSNLAEEEYEHREYEDVENKIKKQWDKYSRHVENYFKKTFLIPEEHYIVRLTKYGVGGSYWFPNRVILNFKRKDINGCVRTIFHEIIHLSIQSFVEKYKIEHWAKERIVDLVCADFLGEMYSMQNIPIDTKLVDFQFKKYYPNMEEIIKNI